MASLEIRCQGETLKLLEQRAVYWPARKSLLLADWHLGKAGVFGRRGLAVPEGDCARDLARLDTLLAGFDIERLVVLGDLMHAPPGRDDDWPERLAGWLTRHAALSMQVVAGNHDRVRAASLPAGLGTRIDWQDEACVDAPFVFDHEPQADPRGYLLAGHLHPVRRLSFGADRLRAPAFWFRRDYAVLPAFGSFTGGHPIRPGQDDRVFVAGPGAVIDVSKR